MADDGVELVVPLGRVGHGAQLGRQHGTRAPSEAVAQHRGAQEGARVQALGEEQRRMQLAPDALRRCRGSDSKKKQSRIRTRTYILTQLLLYGV